jgi:hypothetical protein
MLPPGRYIFCGTFRRPDLNPASRTLSGTLLCGVRTFLPRYLTQQERPSGPNSVRWAGARRGSGGVPGRGEPGVAVGPAGSPAEEVTR